MKELFFDINAHVSPNPQTLKRFCDLHSQNLGHPSGINEPSRQAALIIEQSRAQIANLIGAQNANQIFFAHSCTHACEWIASIILSHFNIWNVCISKMEHSAVKTAFGKNISYISKFNPTEEQFDDHRIIGVIHLQNEIGIINDLNNLKTPKFIFSDMSQSLGKIPINVSQLNIDAAVFGGHKFGGLDIGFIYLKDSTLWKSFGSGSRYFQDRPGSLNVASIGATATALQIAIDTQNERFQKCQSFQQVFEPGLKSLGYRIIGGQFNRSPNTTFVFHENDCANTLFNLSNKGIYVGLGSACGSMATGVSPTLINLNPTYKNYSHTNFMRFSQWGNYTDKDALYILERINDQKS